MYIPIKVAITNIKTIHANTSHVSTTIVGWGDKIYYALQ